MEVVFVSRQVRSNKCNALLFTLLLLKNVLLAEVCSGDISFIRLVTSYPEKYREVSFIRPLK